MESLVAQEFALKKVFQSLLRICGALLLVLFGLLAGVAAITTMPGNSHRGPLPALSAQERELSIRLRQHVTAIASTEHNHRHHEALEAACAYLESELVASGFVVRREEFTVAGKAMRNLEVTIPSKRSPGRSALVVGAHYDSAQGSPGANDNGTGAAALLELAKRLRGGAETAKSDIVLVLYTNEEPPFFRTPQMGSVVHAKGLVSQGIKVKAMLSLETMGYFSEESGSQRYPWPLNLFFPSRGDFIGFVATTADWRLVRRVVQSFRAHAAFPSEGIAAPRFVPGVDFSDHAAYLNEGMPALMVTDTAPYRYPYYHTDQDTPDQVDFDSLARVVSGLLPVVRGLAADD
ncbi:M28 family peptidase [Acidovorax sp. SUPP2522]|uniref:M28 family peptidase n=1 Tax=unclassified Acidovorax TaxID=2684926 RepID=UPI00234A3364|nr:MULTISPECIES: M28 family peptidase [unclassified Acidovorax]WCM98852.1 M28 family peptidase [Acidovorax sp. GBBC 1281]GKT16668.1 M28 family peptidase [Acidovorax sp. SUPP2522]